MQMKIYKVGGAVRDRLLNRPVHDIDWVVVGATPEMLYQQGFRPVGKDFPVFLHPKTHEEYALARTERKTAAGYHGFDFYAAPDVTIEEDLIRRDLTINAMAEDEKGQIIDPFNGQDDLKKGLLRHVSPAFEEDPVRILRVARFAARFGFQVADETLTLMKNMVDKGEVNALVSERVWQEWAKGLMENQPSIMFKILHQCGALKIIAPEVDALWGVPQRADYHPEIDTANHVLRVLDQTALTQQPLTVRFAALCHDLGKALTPSDMLPRHTGHENRGIEPLTHLCERLRPPSDVRDLAFLAVQYHTAIHRSQSADAPALLALIKNTDAIRRPNRFLQLLAVCQADAKGRLGFDNTQYPQALFLEELLKALLAINAGEIAKNCSSPKMIPEAIDQAKLTCIENHILSHVKHP